MKSKQKTIEQFSMFSDLKLIKAIQPCLLEGEFQLSGIWQGIIRKHQILNWSLIESEQIKQLIKELITVCNLGIEEKNPLCITLRAYMYQEGIGGEINYPAAMALYEQASALGNDMAMNKLAYMYENGQGVDVNYSAAIELYERAITLGNASAMRNLAYMYQTGLGVEVNYPAAIELYERAIALGNASAMNNLASTYRTGQGIDIINYPAAIEFYKQAIALGNDTAMCNLAYMYQNGLGLEVNYPAAIELYELAIALGNATAMNNLASIYENGQGVEVNYPAAMELYEQAITLGNASARHNLAYMHQEGLGTDPENTSKLLNLLWESLINGRDYSENTMSSFKKHCRCVIIEKLQNNDSVVGTSIRILKGILSDNSHPLYQILFVNDEHDESYRKSLQTHINLLLEQRETIVKGIYRKGSVLQSTFKPYYLENAGIYFRDIYNKICFFVQPGIIEDKEEPSGLGNHFVVKDEEMPTNVTLKK